jgi:DNA-directed RNA polymerase subunit RPC12/RpoP
MIIKCMGCGKPFSKEGPIHDEIVCCPICDAPYKAIVRYGELFIQNHIFIEKSPGEFF